MSASQEIIVIFGEIEKESKDAILLNDGTIKSWLPKSQIKYNKDSQHETIAVDIPEWLAKNKGFV